MRETASPERPLVTIARATTLALAWLLSASLSHAQPSPSGSLAERAGFSAASKLLESASPDDRLRGVERLGALGDERATERLIELLEGGLPASRDPRAKLLALRALAPFADREPVALALASVVANQRRDNAFAPLLRDAATMALARAGDTRALEILTTMLGQGGGMGESAKQALLAHPPATLLPLPAPEAIAPGVSALLGELGDLRAKGPLRTTWERARSAVPMDEAAATAAAIALAKLGDEAPLEVARAWVKADRLALKLAGAEVLALHDANEAGKAIAELLGIHESRGKALELAAQHPSPALVAPLLGIARAGDREGRKLAFEALGKLASPEALAALESMLAEPTRADEAATALALSPGDPARKALERALASPPTRRAAAKAGALRKLVRGEAPSGLRDALESLLRSSEPSDQAAAAFGIAALEPERAMAFLVSKDPTIARAAALALSAEKLATLLPVAALVEWADERSPFAPLALRALGYRDGARVRPLLERSLLSPNPLLRAHAARGLGQSARKDASARLARAYAFETEPKVRLSIIEALAERREPQRLRTLELAASLEADPEARQAARRALDAGAKPRANEPGAFDPASLDLAFSR